MKLFRQAIFHCAYVALLATSGACLGSIDNAGQPSVEAASESHDLRASKKKHKKKKHKKHWDKCEPATCESVDLKADSHKHKEVSEELGRAIRVKIPQKLPALFWGSKLEAELTFEDGDETVVCTYVGKAKKLGRSLELEGCDNDAEAGDIVSFDTVTLELQCSTSKFAKVHVKLHEEEPCGETTCDPSEVDDGNPCTIDACDASGRVTHTPATDGTACDDGNVCNGRECCQAGQCVSGSTEPLECVGEGSTVVFSTDFDGALPGEISPGTATLTPVQGFAGLGTEPRKFGGTFLRSPTKNRVTLELSGLPPHDKLDLRFLFAAIDSLDGAGEPPAGEAFIVRVDDVVIFEEAFANTRDYQIQTYVPPAGVQLARKVSLGFRGGGEYRDSAYDLGQDPTFLGIMHSASTVTISFEYVGPGAQNINDESWAMDQLEVSVNAAETCADCAEPPPVVDDDNPCTVDSCDPELGVRHEFVAEGTSCGDAADACSGAPTCNAQGECVPSTQTQCDDGNACNGVEQCDPERGCVAGTPLDCDDGNACNGAEQCDEMLGCVSGPALDCDDGNACNGVEQCSDTQGCIPGIPLDCDDGNVCNGVEQCDEMQGCIAGPALNCDDGNACNGVEQCDPTEGCSAGTALDCDDGDACNGVEQCDDAQGCIAGTPLSCDDGNACNGVEQCDPQSGCVTGTALQCDNGNMCDGAEQCDDTEGCVPGTPPVIDDGNDCTIDSCDPELGVVREFVPAGEECNNDPDFGCDGRGRCVALQ